MTSIHTFYSQLLFTPDDGGCQVRCSGRGTACPKATQLCARLKHCVRVEVNKGGTWATLKSFQA